MSGTGFPVGWSSGPPDRPDGSPPWEQGGPADGSPDGTRRRPGPGGRRGNPATDETAADGFPAISRQPRHPGGRRDAGSGRRPDPGHRDPGPGRPDGDETALDAFTPLPRSARDAGGAPPGPPRGRLPADDPALGRRPPGSPEDSDGGQPGGDQDDEDEAGRRKLPGGTHRAAPGSGKGKRKRGIWRELPVLVVIAVVLALVIKTYVIQAFYIPSGSMQNTLAIGDRVLINKVVYHTRGIERGDIVVFDGTGSWDFGQPAAPSNPFVRFFDALEGVVGLTHSSDIYIKRVIGLPGDHVACCTMAGQVTVNGTPLSEQPYLYPGNAPSQTKFSVVIPPGRLWVMGDHRDVSWDSRGHQGDPGGGTIPQSGVIGRAFVIIWPPSKWGFLNIPATFSQPQLSGSAAAALDGAEPGDRAVAVQPAWSPLPLALGTAGAVPLTWLQRRARRRRDRSPSRRRGGG
ncbi:MAG TPA: signal peptidase I [Trebonia sp.]|nr:signal peptidase I [Trebonia sp.]